MCGFLSATRVAFLGGRQRFSGGPNKMAAEMKLYEANPSLAASLKGL